MKNLVRIIVLILVMVAVGGARAQQLNEQEAKARAMRYLTNHGKVFVRGENPSGKELALTSATVEARSIYAFNREGGGYVIASADSRALPVLGYSDTGTIDWEQMPENMRVWLRQYDEAIATLGDHTDFIDGDCTNGRMTTRTSRDAIDPLIKAIWYQIQPYYNNCPLYEGADTTQTGKRCLTGCIATSMAQVMYHYQWPKQIADGLPGYDIVTELENGQHVWHIDSLPPVTFEWADMLDCYLEPRDGSLEPKEILGTEAQQQAVATLMRYCGQAVQMEYDTRGSAASFFSQYLALINYFDYRAATIYDNRFSYGIDEWEDIIYGELAAGRPVLYMGRAEKEGHAFVCDGYDGNGLFHINWGWGGKDDGFFSLAVLNPYNNTSAGAAASGIGFSMYQGAITRLDPTLDPQSSPEEERPMLYQSQPLELEDEHTVTFYYTYSGKDAGTAIVDYAFGTRDDSGILEPRFIGDPSDSIVYQNNYMIVEIDSMAFQPGDSLRLYPMLRFRHAENPKWVIIPPDDYCVDAGRTDEGTFFIHFLNNEGAYLQCVSGAITKGKGVVGERCDVTVVVSNSDEKDFVGKLKLTPYYEGQQEGSIMECGAYLYAGQEGEVTFSYKPHHSGPISLTLTSAIGLTLGSFTLDINEPTGINEVKNELQQKPIQTILLPKEIYIKDGKKYLKK